MSEAEVIAACIHDLNATKGTNEPGTKEWYELSIASLSLLHQVSDEVGTTEEDVEQVLRNTYKYSARQARLGDVFANE